MKKTEIIISVLLLILIAGKLSGQELTVKIGEKHTIKSAILSEDREILIHLPENYNSSEKTYPVLLRLDGSQILLTETYVIVNRLTYSYEIGTPSATLPNQVPDAIKQARYERLMQVQQGISLAKNQALVGQTLDILVEGHGISEDEDGNPTGDTISLGRSYRDAPEIDGYVLVEGELPPGEIVPVRVTGATTYDLIATVDTAGPTVIQPGQIIGEGQIKLD